MDDLQQRFEHAVAGIAQLAGYPHGDRRQAWLDRLRVNLPELGASEGLQPAAELGYLSPPTADVAAGGVPPGDDVDGIAATARACRADPQRIAAPAQAALADAQARKDLNAFVTLADAATLDAGAAVAARLRDGAPLPLLGVPVAVKDLMQVAGFPQTNGSGGARPAPSAHDATVVARPRAAGALVIGTANLHELAYGITSENPHHGWVVNPRGPGYTAGGSSGGSAAAVAAGIVRLAIGTDTAGSIRLPASCCGVVGFKPTFDAVPRDGVQTLGASLDHVGPIAASVVDAALAFSVMAGQPVRTASRAPLAGLRVGVPHNHFFDPLADDVTRAVDAALARMRDDGAELVPIELPGIEHSAALQFVTLCSEATDLHWQRLVARPETLGADVRVRLEIGQFLPASWYVRAQRGRAELDARCWPARCAASTCWSRRRCASSRRAQHRHRPARRSRRAAAHRGHCADHAVQPDGMPALTLPCGVGDNGLPIGVQVAGRRGDDWRVLNRRRAASSSCSGRAPDDFLTDDIAGHDRRTETIMKRIFRSVLAVSATAFAAAAYVADPIVIGVSIAQSPPGSVVQGTQVKDGVEIVVKMLNDKGGVLGRQLKVVYEDNQGIPEKGRAATEKLISRDKVVAITGGHQSSVCLAEIEVAHRNKIPYVNTNCWSDDVRAKGYPEVFNPGNYNTRVSSAMAETIAALKVKSVIAFAENTDYGIGQAKLLGEFLQKTAPQTQYKYVALDRAGKDFTPAVLPLRASPPDLVVNMMLPPAAYILMNQLYWSRAWRRARRRRSTTVPASPTTRTSGRT